MSNAIATIEMIRDIFDIPQTASTEFDYAAAENTTTVTATFEQKLARLVTSPLYDPQYAIDEISRYVEWLHPSPDALVNVFRLDGDNRIGQTVRRADAIKYLRQYKDHTIWCSVNELRAGTTKTKIAADDVERRRNLPFDFDREGDTKSCATDAERDEVRKRASAAFKLLQSAGMPSPLVVMSGNGYYLIYPANIPCTPESKQLVQRLTAAVKANHPFDTGTLSDASRVLGVVGTLNDGKRQIPEEGREAQWRTAVTSYPVRCEITVDALRSVVERLEALVGATAPPVAKVKTDYPKDKERDVQTIQRCLSFIRNSGAGLDYSEWLKVGMAIHSVLPDEDGFNLWENWGSQSEKHNVHESWHSWTHFKDRADGVTLGTLVHMAHEGGMPKAKADTKEIDAELAKLRCESAAAKPKAKGLKIQWLADVEEKEVEWLWPDMIPLGGLTIVAGEGETGKSTMVSEIVARMSQGREWPDGTKGERHKALYIGVEEDLERVIKPRCRKMGADQTIIGYAAGKTVEKDGREVCEPWTLKDLDELRETLKADPDIKLIILDPIGVYFGTGVDSYKDQEVQVLLQPLSKLAQEFGVTIIGIAHLGKGETRSIRNRILGSVALPNTARCVIGVVRDKQDIRKSWMGIVKCNLGGKRTSLEFSTADGLIEFGDEIDLDLEGFAKGSTAPSGRNSDQRERAKEVIQSELADGLPHDSKDVKRVCESMGISLPTAKRAAIELGVTITESKVFPFPTTWQVIKKSEDEGEPW